MNSISGNQQPANFMMMSPLNAGQPMGPLAGTGIPSGIPGALNADSSLFSTEAFQYGQSNFLNPINQLNGQYQNIGFNNGMGMVPGMQSPMAGTQNQAVTPEQQKQMQQMQMMLQMMMQMMMQGGMAQPGQSNQQQNPEFNSPLGMMGANQPQTAPQSSQIPQQAQQAQQAAPQQAAPHAAEPQAQQEAPAANNDAKVQEAQQKSADADKKVQELEQKVKEDKDKVNQADNKVSQASEKVKSAGSKVQAADSKVKSAQDKVQQAQQQAQQQQAAAGEAKDGQAPQAVDTSGIESAQNELKTAQEEQQTAKNEETQAKQEETKAKQEQTQAKQELQKDQQALQQAKQEAQQARQELQEAKQAATEASEPAAQQASSPATHGAESPAAQNGTEPATPAAQGDTQIPDYGPNASKQEIGEMLEAAAKKYGIPVDILKAVAQQESGWNPKALSFDGQHGKGVMQIDDRFHEFAKTQDVFDPAKNIDYGAKYLRSLYDQTGSWQAALKRYNGGSDYPPKIFALAEQKPWENNQA